MAGSMERAKLHVEGDDDFHSLIHLLIRNGFAYDTKPWPPAFPELVKVGDVDKVLEGMETAVAVSNGGSVGFVLDADTPLQTRWRAVRTHLLNVDVATPETPLTSGFIGDSSRFKARVGIWLMPDNEHDGSLEDFLRTLIHESDPLIDHALDSTSVARKRGASFPNQDQSKAIVHTWLAWQEDPGRPYGRAIQYKYFQERSSTTDSFVRWFKRLYGIA